MSKTKFSRFFSWARVGAIMLKEFIEMRRDRGTFAMIVGIPIVQLILFGYAINSNPKHLPTAIIGANRSQFTRSFAVGLQNTKYFKLINEHLTLKQANLALDNDKIKFLVQIPPNFTHNLVRGHHPNILMTADATDPMTGAYATAAVSNLVNTVFNEDLRGPLANLKYKAPPAGVIVHAKFNPAAITQYNIIPGLLGVVLTMTLVMITAQAITREYERGTIESLLATPIQPIEVMVGKCTPYIIVGYIQAALILLLGVYLFNVPFLGHLGFLLVGCLIFILANLAVGITFSTFARSQLQAGQMTLFFFLPSILLSGFMFPFYGMPKWAQWIGQILPLTHFLRLVRGIMLKGDGVYALWANSWPMLLFLAIMMIIALTRYRTTLN